MKKRNEKVRSIYLKLKGDEVMGNIDLLKNKEEGVMSERFIEIIAELCNQVNRAYCEAIGDSIPANWNEAPDWQKKSAVEGVKYSLNNADIAPKESHENWLKTMIADGWKYGKVKDMEKKEHPCLVSYDKLPKEQKVKDFIFKAICDFWK